MELQMKFTAIAVTAPYGLLVAILKKDVNDGEGLMLHMSEDIAEAISRNVSHSLLAGSNLSQVITGKMAEDLGFRISGVVIDEAEEFTEPDEQGLPQTDWSLFGSFRIEKKDGTVFTYRRHAPDEILALAVTAKLPIFVTEEIFEKYKVPLPLFDSGHDGEDPDSSGGGKILTEIDAEKMKKFLKEFGPENPPKPYPKNEDVN